MDRPFQEDWRSLRTHVTPQWLRDGKFGIYTHWGAYCVPGVGPNVSWYPHNMYRPGTLQYEAHRRKYGSTKQVGYKDLIAQFRGEKFDPHEWADIFAGSGAKFAGPVAEHHDGFPMWDTNFGSWNAFRMGPKRDVVGELSQAYRAKNMKFLTAMHHAENWWFFPHWMKGEDVADPAFEELYGEIHDTEIIHNPEEWFGTECDHGRQQEWTRQSFPSEKFLERWLDRLIELIDNYEPDIFFFDFGLGAIPENLKKRFLAYYYNKQAEWDREVTVTYKADNLPPGVGLVDFELGGMSEQTYFEWITDTTIDTGSGWGYMEEEQFKRPRELIHCLIDNVSKNGYLLLNVGPRPDGTIPEGAKATLANVGQWLDVNGEAIYGTVPWHRFGEGPTSVEGGHFAHTKAKTLFTREDFRFTCRGNAVYAICLGEPLSNLTIKSFAARKGTTDTFGFGTFTGVTPHQIKKVEILGVDGELHWRNTDLGLNIDCPSVDLPSQHATTFKITFAE